jgi:hypothetical protein
MPNECISEAPNRGARGGLEETPVRDYYDSCRTEEGVKDYKEPRMETLRNWEVTIKVLTVGCIISVGCKAIAFTSLDEGLKELQEYFKDPSAARAKWSEIENKLNHVN